MVPPKPRRKGSPTFESIVLDTLTAHRGRLLTDCRWMCVCGWRSEREGEGGNHAAHGEREGRIHQTSEISRAVMAQAKAEQEENTDEV